MAWATRGALGDAALVRHGRGARECLAFSHPHLQRDRQDGRFRFGAERSFDAPAARAFEHQVFDETAALGAGAVRGDIEPEREERAVHGADEGGTRALSNFDSHEFGAALFEANLRLGDHGEFEPAGRG